MSFNGGYQSSVGGASVNGAVFITDVRPKDTNGHVGNKQFSSDGKVLDACLLSSPEVWVDMLAITGKTHFKPTIWVNGLEVVLQQDEDQDIWTGTISINAFNQTQIKAVHEDGAVHSCQISFDEIPVITKAEFSGDYPLGQTELKEGDEFSLTVESDSPVTAIELDDFGVSTGALFQFQETLSKTVQLMIANRGNATATYGVRLRIINQNGTKSEWYLTTNYGSEDGRHSLKLNNLHPNLQLTAIHYPLGQAALKDQEKAGIEHQISHFDEVYYDSPNGELSIMEPALFAGTKEVQRQSGSYNISEPNLKIRAKRRANGAISESDFVVQIAHSAATLTLLAPESRFPSGGNRGTSIQESFFQLQSSQLLLEPPLVNPESGQLQGTAKLYDEANAIYRQKVLIHDDDSKGVFALQLVQAYNLAGIPIAGFTGSAQYEVGGFVQRILPFEAFSRTVVIGTTVSDTGKLEVKDQSERLMQYAANFQDGLLAFTIVNQQEVVDEKGNVFYWNDEQAVNNNTTGLATISIEEKP